MIWALNNGRYFSSFHRGDQASEGEKRAANQGSEASDVGQGRPRYRRETSRLGLGGRHPPPVSNGRKAGGILTLAGMLINN